MCRESGNLLCMCDIYIYISWLLTQAMHAAPMYIAETSPSHIRGQLISMKEFFIVFGMLVSNPYSDIF